MIIGTLTDKHMTFYSMYYYDAKIIYNRPEQIVRINYQQSSLQQLYNYILLNHKYEELYICKIDLHNDMLGSYFYKHNPHYIDVGSTSG